MQAFFCGPFLPVFLWIFGRPGQRSKMRWQFFRIRASQSVMKRQDTANSTVIHP